MAAAGHQFGMPTEWITHAAAMALVGCSKHVIDDAQKTGRIKRRHCHARQIPTLNRASVLEFAERWQGEQAELAERERRRAQQAPAPPPPAGPPTDGDVWLDTVTASLVIGITPQYLARLVRNGRIPATPDRRLRKFWFRRRDVEQYAAARAFVRQFAA